jgi:hypothetical protein
MATRPAGHDPAQASSPRAGALGFAALRRLLPAALALALALGALWSAPPQPVTGLREATASGASAVRERVVEARRSAGDRILAVQRRMVELHRSAQGG